MKEIWYETLKETRSINFVKREFQLNEIEKWQTNETVVNTYTTNGKAEIIGNSIYFKSPKTNTEVRHTTKLHSRLFFDNGSFITLNNCDFIAQKGDIIKVISYVHLGKTSFISIENINKNFTKFFLSEKDILNNILKIKTHSIKRNGIIFLSIFILSIVITFSPLVQTTNFLSSILPIFMFIIMTGVWVFGIMSGIDLFNFVFFRKTTLRKKSDKSILLNEITQAILDVKLE